MTNNLWPGKEKRLIRARKTINELVLDYFSFLKERGEQIIKRRIRRLFLSRSGKGSLDLAITERLP